MISDKYKDLYLSTTKDQLHKLSDFLVKLEKHPQNQGLLENIFRLIHSMKGAAATMGYKKTVNLLHAMEDIFDGAFHNSILIDSQTIDLLLDVVSELKENLKSIKNKNQEKNLTKYIKQFKAISKNSPNKKNKANSQSSANRHILGSLPEVAEISLSTEKMDKIENYLTDLLMNVMEIKEISKQSGSSRLLSLSLNSDKILSDLRREIKNTRIVPLSQIFSSLPYLVREVARQENKQVEFQIEDNDLSLDKAILDELVEILIQLLKNAVSHGIEQGKKGQIKVVASLEDDLFQLSVSDNGQGINWPEVIKLAVKNKIITKAVSQKLTKEQKEDLLFQVGISKGSPLTPVSGRGVGLNLVKKTVASLEGQIKVDSQPGKGTTFLIKFPLPLSVFRGLIFEVNGTLLAIPLNKILKVIQLSEVKELKNKKYFSHERRKYELIYLEKIWDLPDFDPLYKYVVLLKYDKRNLALPIFSNVKEEELISKRTPAIVRNIKWSKSIAVSSQGQPILILDTNNLSEK